jgi:hypothetical protein
LRRWQKKRRTTSECCEDEKSPWISILCVERGNEDKRAFISIELLSTVI